ncbi:MAG: hypothetical protein IJJ23_03385 [Clostridia bacterium]|nr:hypothetical protein [Clostridia bacterium]
MALLFFSTVLLVASFNVNKLYQQSSGTLKASIWFNALLGLFASVSFLLMNGFRLETNSFSFFMSALSGIFVILHTLCGFRIISIGRTSLYTMFVMAGGMLLPYTWGIVVLNETFYTLHLIGLSLILISMALFNMIEGGFRKDLLIPCVLAFLFNGIVGIVTKEHQISSRAVSSMDFVIMSNLVKLAVCSAILLFLNKTAGSPKKQTVSRRQVLLIFLSAITSGLSYLAGLVCAKTLPASLYSPLQTGGTILLSAMTGRVFFAEKLTHKDYAALALCLIGTCLFIK